MMGDNDNKWAYQWFRCDRELPAKEGAYLIYAKSADPDKPLIHEAWFNTKTNSWELIPSLWAKAITHWMFMPNPPKDK